jgi:hypothetical protein
MSEETTVEVVDQKTGEITEASPEDLLVAASEAAKALERVIKLNERPPLMFNGKRYLEFHHWQTIGAFYHVTTETYDPEPVEIDGVKGFRAKASALDSRTGLRIGGAEAYCFRDEPNWKTKPLFQLASMAQTRAASKALANKFRFVAIVAGYEGTPSEEMIGETQRQVAMPKSKSAPAGVPEKVDLPAAPDQRDPEGPGPGVPDTGKPQSKYFVMLHAKAREKKVDSEKMRQVIAQMFRRESSKDLVDSEAAILIQMIESGKLS